MAKSKYNYELRIMCDDGVNSKPFSELTPEQQEEWADNARNKISKTLSEYYSNHLDEFELL